MSRTFPALLGALLVAACSAGVPTPDGGRPDAGLPDAGPPDAGQVIPADETWADGKHLTTAVTIPAGRVVELAAGATVTVDAAATITVSGTLRGASGTLRGSAWGGLVVASGGVVSLSGVTLAGATTAFDVRGGGRATLTGGTITGANTPFLMAAGSALSLAHVAVTGASAQSTIAGQFDAAYLDYQKVGGSEGLVLSDPQAVVTISDSTFSGTTTGAGDYLVSSAARSLRVEYSIIRGAHCGFHFGAVGQFVIDHVTSGGLAVSVAPGDTNAWGGMFYGAGAGPNVISNSNFVDTGEDIDLIGSNGTLTILNTHTGGRDNLAPSAGTTFSWAPAEHAAAPIPDAHPR